MYALEGVDGKRSSARCDVVVIARLRIYVSPHGAWYRHRYSSSAQESSSERVLDVRILGAACCVNGIFVLRRKNEKTRTTAFCPSGLLISLFFFRLFARLGSRLCSVQRSAQQVVPLPTIRIFPVGCRSLKQR